MMIIYKADDGSHFELEEIGEGRLRIFFKDGITRQEAQAYTTVNDIPNIYKVMQANKTIAEDFRQGTPTPPRKNSLVDR